MDATVKVVTTITDGLGRLITEVTTVERCDVGGNPSLLRSEISNRDPYGKATSLNLDQLEARFTRG